MDYSKKDLLLTTQSKLPQSIFPDLPRGEKIVDASGMLTQIWHLSLASLYQALQKNFSNEGFQIPQLNASQITYIESLYTPFVGQLLPQYLPNISGKMVYDYTNSVPKMFIITLVATGNPATEGTGLTAIATAGWKTFTLV